MNESRVERGKGEYYCRQENEIKLGSRREKIHVVAFFVFTEEHFYVSYKILVTGRVGAGHECSLHSISINNW